MNEEIAAAADAAAAEAEQEQGGWYCPECGVRYAGPATCTNDHQAVAAVPVDEPVHPEYDDEAAATDAEAEPKQADEIEPDVPFEQTPLGAAWAELDRAHQSFRQVLGA